MDGTPHPRPSAHPETIATHAIRLLDARLRERFGVRVPIGAELEFTLHYKPDAPALRGGDRDPLRLGSKNDGSPASLFPHSRFVRYCYREGGEAPMLGERGAVQQYEAVTDHRHPLPADRLPDALNQLRHALRAPVGQPRTPPRPAAPDAARIDRMRARRDLHHAWAAANLADLRFDSGRDTFIINGLHLNTSIHDAATGENLLAGPDDRSQQIIACSRALFADPDGLLFSSPAQQMRRRITGAPDLQLHASEPANSIERNLGVPGRTRPHYIENKTPGADCNMHYAVLLQLAAVYEALAAPGKAPSGSLESILNGLEAGLGTRFLAAERAHPELRSFDHHAVPAKQQSLS